MIHLTTSMCAARCCLAPWQGARSLSTESLGCLPDPWRARAHSATPPGRWSALVSLQASLASAGRRTSQAAPSVGSGAQRPQHNDLQLLFALQCCGDPLVSGSTKLHRPLLHTGHGTTRPPGGAYLMGTMVHTVAPTRLAQRSVGPQPPP